MMAKVQTEAEIIEAIKQGVEQHRFWPEGVMFVLDSMEYCKFLNGEVEESPAHFSASQLIDAACKYAASTLGEAPAYQLKVWGIHNATDFGRAVFALVDVGLMEAKESDRLVDFDRLSWFQKTE